MRPRAEPEGTTVTDQQQDHSEYETDQAGASSEQAPDEFSVEPETDASSDAATDSAPDGAVQYGVGPFSVREVALVGVWVLAFVVSFFSVSTIAFDSVWTAGLEWILTIGLPTAAVFLIVLRRLSPDGIRRVGSLGIDQFASVAFSVSALIWVQMVWQTVAFATVGGAWLRSWVMWVELVLMLAGVALTVFAPYIRPFAEDFQGRAVTTAHRNARPINPVTPRPAPAPRPAPVEPPVEEARPGSMDFDADPYGAQGYQSAPYDSSSPADVEPATLNDVYVGEPPASDDQNTSDWMPEHTRDTYEPATTEVEAPVAHQAFWALAPVERDVLDENGVPMFRVGPTAWALVIEDHGTSYVVRHEDGRVGYLTDVSGVTRG